jgi:hypothetical protein
MAELINALAVLPRDPGSNLGIDAYTQKKIFILFNNV